VSAAVAIAIVVLVVLLVLLVLRGSADQTRVLRDVHERLVLYKRLASCETDEDLDLLREELTDRFGRAPEPVQALIACHKLRLVAKAKGVVKIDAGPERTTLQFVKEPPFDAGKLILLVQRDGRIRFAGPDRIRIEQAAPTLEERVALVRDFLARLR